MRPFIRWFSNLHLSMKVFVSAFIVLVVCMHLCVWVVSWPHDSGQTLENLLGIWMVACGLAMFISLPWYMETH